MTSLPFLYQNFEGGLNSKAGMFLLEDTQARDLLNVQSTKYGAIVKRNGLVTFATPADTLTSLIACEETASPFLIGTGGTSIYSVTTGGVVATIATGLASGVPWSFVQAPASGGQGPLWGMDGTDTPQQWTGAGSMNAWTATTGAVPNGTMCLQHDNRVFVAGTSANPSRLYWSDLGNPRSWPAANVVDLDPNDGEAITGLGLVGPYLMVGKRHKMFIVYNSDTGANRRISDTVGVASHRSIASGPNGTYFLSDERGVYVTDGKKLDPLSDIIQPTIDSIVPGQKSKAAGVFYQGHYYLSVCTTGTVNNQTLDFDTTLNSWWLHSFASNQFAVFHPPTPTPGLFSAKASSAIIDQCLVPNVFSDNGSSMTWVWRGPWQSPTFYRRRRFPTPYFRKRLRQVRVMGTGTVDFSIAKDFVQSETLWQSNIFGGSPPLTFGGAVDGSIFGASDGSVFGAETTTYGGGATIQQARLYSLGVADAFSLVLGSTSNTADSVDLYVLEITDRRDNVVS